MSDPMDPFASPPSPGSSREGGRRPRPKKAGSIWMVAIVVMFLVIVCGYLMTHMRGGADPAPNGPHAIGGAVTGNGGPVAPDR